VAFSTEYACPNCDISLKELSPRMFSFNSPFGACTGCLGLWEPKWNDPVASCRNPDCPFTTALFIPGVPIWRMVSYHVARRRPIIMVSNSRTPFYQLTKKNRMLFCTDELGSWSSSTNLRGSAHGAIQELVRGSNSPSGATLQADRIGGWCAVGSN